MQLAEITQWWGHIVEMLEASDNEVTPEIQAELDAYQFTESDKVDGYVVVLKEMEARLAAAESVRKALVEPYVRKEKTLASHIEWLKGNVQAHMVRTGVRELLGKIWKFRRQDTAAPLLVGEYQPKEFAASPFVRCSYEWDKKALRAAIEDTENPQHVLAVSLARIGPKGESVRVY